ncbi:hypothetical protein [Vibrio marisflavi]|uniref:ABC transmembrane type-1 domain-containing protein n=1 Tax=Vibrio marisflavi CECT 7928 TaxID=634439 RepID=A0ABM9A1B2_9VIBR|nr:hypothetical protein [Vibrio marisflavi]CAH0537307.1 hypothetical protein VMF7928_01044 [Vibrio marisflavi CECT 7928]
MNSLGKFNTEAKLVLELIDSMSPSPLMVASSVVFLLTSLIPPIYGVYVFFVTPQFYLQAFLLLISPLVLMNILAEIKSLIAYHHILKMLRCELPPVDGAKLVHHYRYTLDLGIGTAAALAKYIDESEKSEI